MGWMPADQTRSEGSALVNVAVAEVWGTGRTSHTAGPKAEPTCSATCGAARQVQTGRAYQPVWLVRGAGTGVIPTRREHDLAASIIQLLGYRAGPPEDHTPAVR